MTSVPCPQLGLAGFSRRRLAQHQDQLLKPALAQVWEFLGPKSSQWFLTASQGTCGSVWRQFGCHSPWEEEVFLLASREQRPGCWQTSCSAQNSPVDKGPSGAKRQCQVEIHVPKASVGRWVYNIEKCPGGPFLPAPCIPFVISTAMQVSPYFMDEKSGTQKG